MRDDQIVFSIDGNLDVVADNTTPDPRPLVAVDRETGSVSDILLDEIATSVP